MVLLSPVCLPNLEDHSPKWHLLVVTPKLGQFWPPSCDFTQVSCVQWLILKKPVSGDHRGPYMLHLPFLNEWTSWSKKVFTRSWSAGSAASSLQSAATRRASAKQPHRAELSTAAWLGLRCLYFITSIFLQEILKCSHYLKGGGENTHELHSYP